MLSEYVDQSQNFQIICNSEVLSGLAVDDVAGVNADNDFRLILHFFQKLNLSILIKSRKHAHCMLVMDEFSSELQVQSLTVACIYSLQNILGLLLYIFFRIKAHFVHFYHLFFLRL